MRLDKPNPASQFNHASGAFWPYCFAAPDQVDAAMDAERAAFEFWKKTRGIHTATAPDAQPHAHQKSGKVARADAVEAVDYEAAEVLRQRYLTNAGSADNFEAVTDGRNHQCKEVSGRAAHAEGVNFTSGRSEAPKDVDQPGGNGDSHTRDPRAVRGSRQRSQTDRVRPRAESQLVEHRGEKASSLPVASYEWVRLSKHCEVTGDTPDAVHARRRKRIWIDGVQCKVGPDGNLYINPTEYNKWINQN